MRRAGWIGWLILALFAVLLLPDSLMAMSEAPAVGKLITIQGQVTVRRGNDTRWEPAQVGQPLGAGDAVRTGPASSASILCVDESQIKLNENTIVILKSIAPSPRLQPVTPAKGEPPPASHYEVPEGEIWLRNKHEKFRFELETPAVTAIIRGTELNIRVQRNGTTSVILLEGNVCIANPQGEVCLRPGEEGYAVPGQKPTKQVLVQPTDAVQWVLYYPGIISYRDLPLTPLPGEFRSPPGSPAVAPLIQEGEAAYDQGRLQEAREKAEAVLAKDPENCRALTLLGWVSLQENQPDEALKHFQPGAPARRPDHRGPGPGPLRPGGRNRGLRTHQGGRPERQTLAPPGRHVRLLCPHGREGGGGPVPAGGGRDPAAPGPPVGPALAGPDRPGPEPQGGGPGRGLPGPGPGPRLAHGAVQHGPGEDGLFRPPRGHPVPAKGHRRRPPLCGSLRVPGQDLAGLRVPLPGPEDHRPGPADWPPGTPRSSAWPASSAWPSGIIAGPFSSGTRPSRPTPGSGNLTWDWPFTHFRYREFRRGLEEMLTATLLDPRVASYQTELGKALYQTRSFDRALEVYDYAKTLDPKDPTPYFYKGIALTDLNRPGEAVQEINKSIELNDNVAMFRSRSLLDQDLAVRNYSLAKSYQQLGLNEWAYSKAVTAVNYHPHESSAHLFLRDVIVGARAGSEAPFLTGGLLFSTANTEATLYRVLSRANQATFSNVPLDGTEALGFTTDYTPMFEMPYGRVVVSGGIGAWEGRKSIQDHQGLVYGGAPGVAVAACGKIFRQPRGELALRLQCHSRYLRRHAAFLPTSGGGQMGAHRQGDPHRIR